MMIENNENMNIVELNDSEMEEISGGKSVKATGHVNIRKGPSLEFGILGTLPKGQKLVYDGHNEKDKRGVTWYRVKYRGSFGWVSSKFSKLI